MNMQIEVGRKLFEFESYQQWVNKASSWYGNRNATIHNTVSVDMNGCICATGKEFAKARDEDAFPVKVYSIEVETTSLLILEER